MWIFFLILQLCPRNRARLFLIFFEKFKIKRKEKRKKHMGKNQKHTSSSNRGALFIACASFQSDFLIFLSFLFVFLFFHLLTSVLVWMSSSVSKKSTKSLKWAIQATKKRPETLQAIKTKTETKEKEAKEKTKKFEFVRQDRKREHKEEEEQNKIDDEYVVFDSPSSLLSSLSPKQEIKNSSSLDDLSSVVFRKESTDEFQKSSKQKKEIQEEEAARNKKLDAIESSLKLGAQSPSLLSDEKEKKEKKNEHITIIKQQTQILKLIREDWKRRQELLEIKNTKVVEVPPSSDSESVQTLEFKKDKAEAQAETVKATTKERLYPLTSLKPEKWSFLFPTLLSSDHPQKQRLCKNVAEFESSFFQQYPFLKLVDWQKFSRHVVVAGGSVCSNLFKCVDLEESIIFHSRQKYKKRTRRRGRTGGTMNSSSIDTGLFQNGARDVDIFLHSLDLKEAENLLREWHTEMLAISWLNTVEKIKQEIYVDIIEDFKKWQKKVSALEYGEKVTKLQKMARKSKSKQTTPQVSPYKHEESESIKSSSSEEKEENHLRKQGSSEQIYEFREDEQENPAQPTSAYLKNLIHKMKDPLCWTQNLVDCVVRSLRFKVSDLNGSVVSYDEQATIAQLSQAGDTITKELKWVQWDEKISFVQDLLKRANDQKKTKTPRVEGQREQDTEEDKTSKEHEQKRSKNNKSPPSDNNNRLTKVRHKKNLKNRKEKEQKQKTKESLKKTFQSRVLDWWFLLRESANSDSLESTEGGGKDGNNASASFATSLTGDKKLSLFQMRNGSCVSYSFPNSNCVQVMFRIYPSIESILCGFDISSSAVAYDTKNVWFTPLSKWSYEHRANLVDSSHRSPTYELRLQKYFDAPFFFGLVLPFLDMTKIKTVNLKWNIQEVLDFPTLPVSYNKVSGNAIYVTNFLNPGGVQYELQEGSDEDNEDMRKIEKDSYFSMDHDYYCTDKPCEIHNLYVLLHQPDASRLIYTSHSYDMSLFQILPQVSPESILYFYGDLQFNICNRGKMNIEKLRRFFTFEDPLLLCQLLMRASSNLKLKAIVKEMCEKQANIALGIYNKRIGWFEKNQVVLPLPWIVDRPGAQFESSSMEPLPTSHKEFYASYFDFNKQTMLDS